MWPSIETTFDYYLTPVGTLIVRCVKACVMNGYSMMSQWYGLCMSRRGFYKCQPLLSSVHVSLGELRPSLYTYRLNWDSKFEPWFSKAEHTTSLSQRLPTMLIVYEWAEKNVRTPVFTSSDVTILRRNHYTRSPPVIYDNCSIARLKSQNYCLHNLHRWEAVIGTLSASVEPVSTRRWHNAVWMLHHRLQH